MSLSEPETTREEADRARSRPPAATALAGGPKNASSGMGVGMRQIPCASAAGFRRAPDEPDSVRKAKEGNLPPDLFAFLICKLNALAAPRRSIQFAGPWG